MNIPEPPDGTRLEIRHSDTDLYGAHRDDQSSADAGWPVGDGGKVWCLFGSSVPMTWTEMWLLFGESLRGATRLWPGEAISAASDRLTMSFRERNWVAAAAVRDELDRMAGRSPWKISDPPRPAVTDEH